MYVTQRWRRLMVAALLALAVLIAVVVILRPSGAHQATAIATPPVVKVKPKPKPKPKPSCRTAGGAFVPTVADVGGVGVVDVFAAARPLGDAAGTPPETNTGKRMMAWDAPGLKPNGSSQGAVVTDAHSWPDNSALGNTFMKQLHPGAIVQLRGRGGSACYRIVSQTVYNMWHVPASTYATNGPVRLTITICYWPRLGPGNWRNRMIWVGRPI